MEFALHAGKERCDFRDWSFDLHVTDMTKVRAYRRGCRADLQHLGGK